MAYATSIRHTNFQFDGTAITKINDNQSLDYPFSSFTLVSHIYVTPADAEVDWSVQVGPVRPGPDETIVFGPITAAQDPGHYTITATVDISAEGWRTIGVSERNSNTSFPLSITYPGHSSYSGGYMEFSPDFQYIDSGVSAPYTYFPLYDSQSPSGITIANVVASGFTFEPSYNGNTLSYIGVKSVSWDDDDLEYGGPQLYMDPNNQKVVANNFKANTGLTERRFRAWYPIGDTRGNSWIDDFTFIQKSVNSEPEPSGLTPPVVPFVSGQTVTGLCGDIIKAVYKVEHGYDYIKLINDYPPTQVRFKFTDGTNIEPEFINDSPHRFGMYFRMIDYGWGRDDSGFVTVYMTNSPSTASGGLNDFSGCMDLVELYVPESVTSIANNLNGCNNLTNLVIAGTVDIDAIGSFDGAFIYPYPATYSGVPSIVCLSECDPITTSNVFQNIGRNGTLYYPTGTDYSSWLNEEGALASRGWSGESFTIGTIDCSALTPFDVPDPPIPSGETTESGSTSHTITYSGCPLVFDHSASTGTWNALPTVTTGGTTDNWSLIYNVPANDTDSARTITYYYLRYSGETCEDLVDTVSYTISQAAGSGTPTPPDPPIPSGQTINSGSTSRTITYSGCPLVFDHSASTGTWDEYPTLTTGGTTDAWRLTYTVPINTTPSARTVTYYFRRYSGNTCEDYVDTVSYTIEQAAATTEPVVYAQPTYHNVSSDAGVVEYNFYTLNCSFAGAGLQLYSSSITMGDWSTGPAYAEIVKVSDTHMIVRLAYPQNITNQARGLSMSYITLTDAGQNLLTILFTQFEYRPSSGSSATSITLNVDSSITGSGIATTTVNPGDATVNLRYTSSNSTIATIDQNGRITVVRNGQVTICVKDLITGLQDCKTIRVTKGSTPGGDDDDLIYVYTGITVNDNEGHRYNITAEPGYKYGCLGKTYKTVSACEARYSLYYINAYGGVDVLPCKGKSSMKKDNITRYNYSRTFRNNTLEFENTNYLSEIKTTWQLHTGYMVDTQSEKMHHLVESTCVFLYDALEQTYTPVVMTDKTLEYKTFHNQGRTFYDYTINIEESQSKERR